jgi:branched-chain amino acid transport system ATP-binding protein
MGNIATGAWLMNAGKPAPLLDVRNVVVRFGGIVALDGVSFDVHQGQIVGLIGPNGAGKTTLFNCLSRLYHPVAGDILFEGGSILSRPAHRIAEIGICRTFQNVALFTYLTVLDNVMIGAHTQGRSNILSDTLGLPLSRLRNSEIRSFALDILGHLGLEDVAHHRAGTLPFNTQKRVELARALASRPKLLLLDEPAGGLNHEEVGALGDIIRKLPREFGITVLLVEHHMGLVMSISDTVTVLNFGRKIAEGTPAEVQKNALVIDAYLGGVAA